MGKVFEANRDYKPGLDVRKDEGLTSLLGAKPTTRVLFPLVGARRAGKTWALHALERSVGRKHEGGAQFIDLRGCEVLPEDPPARCLLVDEPQLTAPVDGALGVRLRRPHEVLEWSRRLHAKGRTILLAMSPAEWVVLRDAGEPQNLVSSRDLHALPPLTEPQARKLARAGWAKDLFDRVPKAWTRRPFLLELFFQFIEEELGCVAPEGDLTQLACQVREWSEGDRFGYFRTVFWNGLDDGQRDVLRKVARRDRVEPQEVELLERCSILERDGADYSVGDPVLALDLYPLRIHHLSDVHFGPKAARRADVKLKGPLAGTMEGVVDQKRIAEHYVDHVRTLSQKGQAPHVLVISGDIAEWAKDDEYADAREWLDDLRGLLADHPRLPPDAKHVLVAGGNHDVDWSNVEGAAGYRKRHLAFARAFDAVPRSLRTRLEEPPASRALPIERYADLGVEVVLLGSSELGGEIENDPAREALLDFVDDLRRRTLGAADQDQAKALHVVSRIDPGLVHDKDLQRLRQAQPVYPVRIAVLHHPVSPLPATEIARFVGLLNAGEVKDALVHSRVCLVLHGHAHMGWFGHEQWPEHEEHRAWVLRIAAAPSLGSEEVREQHGYNEITVGREPRERETSPYRVLVRRVVREGASWKAGKSMGPFSPGA